MADPKLNARLGLDKREFDKGLKQAESGVIGFGGKLKGLFAAAGLAIGARELIRFGSEAVKLAGRVEGVKIAFDRLNNPTLLADLRKATQNTVADVDLMTSAIRASNFKLPLDQLAKYLEFASRRARETGDNINWLVDSIVLGISRESPKILDNLGLSLAEINEELKKTPDYATAVGNIIDRELGKAGKAVETSAIQVEQLSTAWKNFVAELGKGINNATGVTKFMQQLAESMRITRDRTLTYSQQEKFKAAPMGTYDAWKEANAKKSYYASGGYDRSAQFAQMMQQASGQFRYGTAAATGKPSFSVVPEIKKHITTITTLNEEIELLQQKLVNLDITNKAEIESTQAQIKAKEDLIDTITGVTEAVKENKRTIMDAQQVWNDMVMPGRAGQQLGGAGYGALNSRFADKSQLAEVSEAIGYINTSMTEQTQIASTLGSVFTDMFMDIDQGFKGMADSLIQSIKRIAAEIMAQAAAWAVMKYIFKMDMGNFSSFMGGGGGGVNAGAAAGVGSSVGGDLHLTTYIRGTDLAVVVGRGGNSRYNNT